MKKQLLASLMLVAGTAVFAQTSSRTFTPVTLNNVSRPSSSERTTTCTADTLRYALVKEYAMNATPAFNALPISPAEEQSQAFVSPGTVSIVGVDFRARVNSGNASATVPVKVYLYSVNAAFQPLARLDSASINVITTTAKYYHANFSAPHSTTGNYAVAVAAAGTFKFDIISNDRDVAAGGEALSYNKWNPGTGFTWFANADATNGWGQDFDADISPIVTYTVATDYTTSAASPICLGTALSFTNTTTPMTTLASRMYNYNAFLYYFSGSLSDSTYAWDMGDLTANIWSQNASHTYAAAGTYSVTLYTLAGFWNSCTDTKITTMTVNATPVLAITSPAAVCSPSTVDITASAVTSGSTGGGTLSYWTDAGATASLSSPNAVAAGGTYYIQSANGACTDIDPVTVTINAVDDATITAPSMLCQNASAATLTGATTGGTWSGTGITDAAAGTFDPSVAGAGTFSITYTTAGACPATDNTSIMVMANEDATISGAPSMICDNDVAFNLTGATAGGTWTGTGITDAAAGTFDPSVAGAGTHTITYTTSGTCPGASAANLVVSVCTGIQNNSNASSVSVYPNPSTGVFTVDMGTAVKTTMEVYNVIGAKVFAKQFAAQVVSLDLNGFDAGVYFLKVTADNKQITKQITITK